MLITELWGADGRAQKLEIAVPNDFKVRREGRDIDRRRGPSHEDELALVLEVGCACAELEANVITTAPQAFDSVADGRGLAGQAQVVKVRINQLQPPWGSKASQLGQDRLQGKGEQQRAKRVSVNTCFRRNSV